MRDFLSVSDVKNIIRRDYENRGLYVDTIKYRPDAHGFIVTTIPNPMCTHMSKDGSALREVDGKIVCSICGAEFTK
jgi:hypothetical protein